MSYTDTLLASGERIVKREHQHWFILVGNARFAVLALVLAIALLILFATGSLTGGARDVLGFLTLVLFVGGLAMLGWSWLRYQNEEYLITTRRIIHAEGVVNKQATDSSLEKINDAVLSENVFGRMFGFGDLDVLTASETGIERLRMLRDAKDFKKAMLEAKHELEIELSRPTMPPLRSAAEAPAPAAMDAPPPPPAPAPAPLVSPPASAVPPPAAMSSEDVTGALNRLAGLRDRGIITPEEFEAKKAELLDRL
jgi:hypothetical protein